MSEAAFALAHQQLANGFGQLQEQREVAFMDELENPATSLPLALQQAMKGARFAFPDAENGGYFVTGSDYRDGFAAFRHIAMTAEKYVQTDANGRFSFDFSTAPKDVEELRSAYRTATDADKTGIVTTLAFMAALTKPQDVTERDFKKRPKETPEQHTFRSAVFALRAMTQTRQQFDRKYPDHNARVLPMIQTGTLNAWLCKGPAAETAEVSAQLNERVLTTSLVPNLLNTLEYSNLSGNTLCEQVATAFAVEEKDPTQLDLTPDSTLLTPNKEVSWEILPGLPRSVTKALLAEQGLAAPKGKEKPVVKHEGLSDEDARLLEVGRVALAWYGGDIEKIDVYTRKLGEVKDDEFQIIVLEEQLANGKILRHAIAEAKKSRATYVFRAEHGVDSDGETWLSWEDVFSSNKHDARLLGARKIVHGENYSENLEEYLTRSSDELSQPGYRR